MGNYIVSFFGGLFENEKARILLLGLDAAGKTSLMYKLKLDENVVTVPTIGFNVETIQYKQIEFTMYDVGGQDKIRPLWRVYFQSTDAIIFVVDSNDKERIPEAREELEKIFQSDLLRDAKLLVLANKQDLPDAMNGAEMIDALRLRDMNIDWFVQPCIALHGSGIYDGLEWLSSKLK